MTLTWYGLIFAVQVIVAKLSLIALRTRGWADRQTIVLLLQFLVGFPPQKFDDPSSPIRGGLLYFDGETIWSGGLLRMNSG